MSPWSSFQRAICLPGNCGCEFVDVNAWIAQSSAFWSSFFHLILAYFFYRSMALKDQKMKLWFLSLFLLALGSLFGHGSFLEFAMATDFAGIVLVTSFFATYSWISRFKFSSLKLFSIYSLYFSFLTSIFYSLDKKIKVTICLMVIIIALMQLIKEHGLAAFRHSDLKKALPILALSTLFFTLDELKILCDPNSWLTGHSLWHLGTAISLNYYGRFRLSPV
jgi:hypothetical protein